MEILKEYKRLGSKLRVYKEGVELEGISKKEFIKKKQISSVSENKLLGKIAITSSGNKKIEFQIKDSNERKALISFLQGKTETIEKNSKNKNKRKRDKTAKKILLGIFFFLLIVFILIIGGKDKKVETSSNSSAETNIQHTTKEDTPERKIESKIIEIMGEKTNMEEKRIREIVIENDELWISYTADENLTTAMTRRGMWTDIKKLLQELPGVLDKKISSIVFQPYLNLVDQHGNESISKVMMVTVTKESWEKINWENFLTSDIPNTSKTYWEHPAIK